MNKLSASLKELEKFIPHLNAFAPGVSASSVGWHIEHTLLATNLIIKAVTNSDPQNFKPRASFFKFLVLTINKIPRGRAKAPASVQPKTEYTAATLSTHLQQTIDHVKALEVLAADQFFPHPYFGDLNVKQTIKFLRIHTQHHTAIIRDIISKTAI